MNVRWDGLVALLICLVGALVPLPKKAEIARLGIFAAILLVVVADGSRRQRSSSKRELVPLIAKDIENASANPTADRAERLLRASRLVDSESPEAQWRRLGQLARSRERGVRSAA